MRSLVEMFECAAQAHPSKTAIVGHREVVSYEALGSIASSLTVDLARYGLDCSVVALLFAADVSYVASVLSILASRGVFAPVDVAWPDARLVAALEIARPAALLVRAEELERARAVVEQLSAPCQLLVLEGSASIGYRLRLASKGAVAPRPYNDASKPWQGDSLYLVYTSGSTGTPNAVEGAHLSLAHFIDWQTRAFAVDASCRVAQLAPTTFDVSLRDIFLPLTTGGTLVIPEAGTRYHPVLFPKWVAQHQVNLMHSVPSVLKLACELTRSSSKLRGSFDSIVTLFLSGERLYSDDARQFYEQLNPSARLVNFYGPSEGTLIKTCLVVPRDIDSLSAEVVPLGAAIEGCRVWVDVEAGQSTGEIVIESRYLAKGYYRNPVLTSAKFSSVSGKPGVRAYRTGDLGFQDGRGLLHFIGRKDHQIKVNGNRVELGEVEHCIRRLEGVHDAVVVASAGQRESEPTVSCVYVGEPAVVEERVRKHLRSSLPAYMVPTNIVQLGALPLLSNGKTDRKRIAQLFQPNGAGG